MSEERSPEEMEAIRVAMQMLGRARTPRKTAHLAALADQRRGSELPEAHKAKLREAQAARRQREKAERDAIHPPAPPRPRGRPKKIQEEPKA